MESRADVIFDVLCVLAMIASNSRKHQFRDANPEFVKKFIRELHSQHVLTFAGGEPLLVAELCDYIKLSVKLGHKPTILTNGQLLTRETIDRLFDEGLWRIKISIDAITPDEYRQIRVGGELSTILDALDYINTYKRSEYPDLRIFVNTVILNQHPIEERIAEFEAFFENKIDVIHFQLEHSEGLHLNRTHFKPPSERQDCTIRVKLHGITGKMVPCCALGTALPWLKYDMNWLPNIQENTPMEAFELFVKLYRDPNSTFYKISRVGDRWIGLSRMSKVTPPGADVAKFKTATETKQRRGIEMPKVCNMTGIFSSISKYVEKIRIQVTRMENKQEFSGLF